MGKVGIICDSTCDLGPEWLEGHDVVMVPLKVLFGDESFRDWVDLTPSEFYARLKTFAGLPTTSQPSPAEFSDAYRRLAEQGCEGAVVVTLSAALSGTHESAVLGAADAPLPVRIVDSRSASQGTGLVVKAAISARDAGQDLDGVEAAAQRASDQVHVFFVLETLEYLVKGGRAGKAQALAASLLNIKPVLHIDRDGVVEPFRKVKGIRNAINDLAAHVARESQAHPLQVTLLCGERPDLLDMMRAALEASGARYEIESEGTVGAVIGTYTGPEVVGLAYHPLP